MSTGVTERTAIEDERGGVGGIVGGIAGADRRRLADVGEVGDGQETAAQDGRAGVSLVADDRLSAGAVLDERQLASAVGEEAVEGTVGITVADIEGDRRGGATTGVGDGASTDEGASADSRHVRTRSEDRDRGAGSVDVESRALTKIKEGRTRPGITQGGDGSRELERAAVEIDVTREGIDGRQDDQSAASLGEGARGTRDQGADGQGVSRDAAVRGQDDFGRIGPQLAAGDERGASTIIKEDPTRGISKDTTEGDSLGSGDLQGVDRLGGRGSHRGVAQVVGRRDGRGGRETGRVSRVSGGGRVDEARGDPVDAIISSPTTEDAVGAGWSSGEDDRAEGGDGEIERRARTAGADGSECEGSVTTGARGDLDDALTRGRGQGACGLDAIDGVGAQVGKTSAGCITEGIDIEDDRAGIRQQVKFSGDFLELERAIGDRGGTCVEIGAGRVEQPGAGADLLEINGVEGDRRSDRVIGRVGAAEDEGLGADKGSDRAGKGERTGTAGIDVCVSGGGVNGDRLGEGGRSADVGEGTGLRGGVADPEAGRRVDSAEIGHDERAGVDRGHARVGRRIGTSAEGERTRSAIIGSTLREFVGRSRSEDVALQERVAEASDSERTGGGGIGIPEAGATDGHETIAVIIDGQTGTILGRTSNGLATDDAGETVEDDADAIAGIEVEGRGIAARVARDIAERKRAADGRAVDRMIEEEVAAGIIANGEVRGRETGQVIGTDLERTVIHVDLLERIILTQRAAGGDTEGAAIEADLANELAVWILEPQCRLVDGDRLDESILAGIRADELTRDDDITVTQQHDAVAVTEREVPADRGVGVRGGKLGFVAVAE